MAQAPPSPVSPPTDPPEGLTPGAVILGWVGGFLSAAFTVSLAGVAAWLLEQSLGTTGLGGRILAEVTGRGLTAEAPARLESFTWVVNPIPDEEYYGGERGSYIDPRSGSNISYRLPHDRLLSHVALRCAVLQLAA